MFQLLRCVESVLELFGTLIEYSLDFLQPPSNLLAISSLHPGEVYEVRAEGGAGGPRAEGPPGARGGRGAPGGRGEVGGELVQGDLRGAGPSARAGAWGLRSLHPEVLAAMLTARWRTPRVLGRIDPVHLFAHRTFYAGEDTP